MASRVLWFLYVICVAAFLGRSGDLPSSPAGWLWLGLFSAWLAAAVGVVLRVAWARSVSLLCFVPFAAVLLFVSLGRIVFLLRHGGMDCATCQGSPLLFLWHWHIELLLLAPGLVLAFWFWRSSRVRHADGSNEGVHLQLPP